MLTVDEDGSLFTEELTRDQLIERLEAGAQARLDMSAAEMLKLARAGTLGEAGEVADLLVLAGLLPEDDPIYA